MTIINTFRLEVLIGLWFLRHVATRMVPSWRDVHSGDGKAFDWREIARDPIDAYRTMLDLAILGTVVISGTAGSIIAVVFRVLSGAGWLEPLLYFSFIGPLSSALVCYAVVYWRIHGLQAGRRQDEVTELEDNRFFMFGWSLLGSLVAFAVSAALAAALPDPSSW